MFEDLLSEPQIYRKIQKKKMSTKNQIGFAANIPWDNSITTAHETTPANLSISGAPPFSLSPSPGKTFKVKHRLPFRVARMSISYHFPA